MNRIIRAVLVGCTLSLLCACTGTETVQKKADTVDSLQSNPTPKEVVEAPSLGPTTSVSRPSVDDANQSVMPHPSALKARVTEAEQRLKSTPSGQKIWRAIEAHGGLETWFAQGPLAFRFNYKPLKKPKVRDTYQIVDTWSARARHKVRSGGDVEFGWNGEAAWLYPADVEAPTNVRFWSLTPYFFVAIPFVLADRGAVFTDAGRAKIEDKEYELVKVTYGANVGDAPDDHYVIYLDPDTGKVGGLRYIVSYPGFFKDGGHSPEKLMVLEGSQTIDGIEFAEAYPTYSLDGKAPVEKVTDISLTEVSFEPKTPASYFSPPEGAKILEGY